MTNLLASKSLKLCRIWDDSPTDEERNAMAQYESRTVSRTVHKSASSKNVVSVTTTEKSPTMAQRGAAMRYLYFILPGKVTMSHQQVSLNTRSGIAQGLMCSSSLYSNIFVLVSYISSICFSCLLEALDQGRIP